MQAFRRADYRDRGPFDARFRFYRNLDIWWSLVLRDEGEGETPRRAVRARRPAAGPARAPRLDEPAGRGPRPPEQAQLLPDHRPVRLAARPAGQLDVGRGHQARRRMVDPPGESLDLPPGGLDLGAERVGTREVAGSPGARRAGRRSACTSSGTASPAASSSQTRSRSSPRTWSASRASHRRSSAGRSARSTSRTTTSAVGMSRSSSIAATKRSWTPVRQRTAARPPPVPGPTARSPPLAACPAERPGGDPGRPVAGGTARSGTGAATARHRGRTERRAAAARSEVRRPQRLDRLVGVIELVARSATSGRGTGRPAVDARGRPAR